MLFLMKEGSEGERKKGSRLYDAIALFSEEHQHWVTQLLRTGATLERGYEALPEKGSRRAFQPQVNGLDKMHQQWLATLASFNLSLRAQGVEPKAIKSVEEAFQKLAERVRKLAG